MLLSIQQKKINIKNNVQNNSARTAAIYLFSSVLRFWLKTLQLARDAAEKLRFHSVGWLRHIFMDFKCSFSVFMSIEFCGSETFTCSVLWGKKQGWERGKNEKKFSTLCSCPVSKQTGTRWDEVVADWTDCWFGLLFYCFMFQKHPERTWPWCTLCGVKMDQGCLCWDCWGAAKSQRLS